MQIIQSKRFRRELNTISDFIAEDSKQKAIDFQRELKEKLSLLAVNPKAYRKSTKFNDEDMRDFIYKGYVIPYLIDKDTILILGIYGANRWKP